MSDLIPLLGTGSHLSQSFHEQSGSSQYGTSASQNLLFIDSAVADIDSLIRGAKSSSVFVLDSNRDGVEQILDTLANYQNIGSVHIVSHGNAGSLQLGNTYLSTQTLPYYGLKLQQSAQSLAPNADILLYGCDVGAGESGLAFLRSLQQWTGADIAASTDLTGNSNKGGNWDLEVSVGSIETGLIFDPQTLQQYSGVLPTTYLSDLNWTLATNGWGAIERDKSNGEAATGDGKALTLNGVTYAKGLGVHAGSEINYVLGGAYTNFSSNIGVDDEVGNNGSVVFQVWVDGIRLFNSTRMTGASATQLVNLNVTGKQNLKLIVTNSGDNNNFDHANWADAKLTSGDTPPPAPPALGIPIYLSDLNETSATNAWGAFERDRSNGEQGAADGNPLTLNGVTYAKGLGVHAGSEIIYNLGGAYTNFSSNIGLDDEVGNAGSVVFQVFVDGVQLFTSGTMTGASATQLVNLNVTGKQTLRLVVTNAGDNNSNDHANWADAKLTAGTILPPAPPPPETIAPTAALTATTLVASRATPYTFTVAYTDATAVDVSTINNTDIRVTGPNGFTQLAQRVNVTPNANGQALTATYQIAAPDGIWNWNDNGTYTATLLAGEVRDTLGNASATNTQLGTFQVAIQSTIVIGRNSSQVNEGGVVTIPIQRLGDTSGTASVQYYTGGNATAIANVDYTAILPTTLVFAPGEVEKQITIQTLNDAIAEANEVFSLLIDGTQGADLGPSRTSQVTIIDPNAPPAITYLSDLIPTAVINGWGPMERDRSNGEEAANDGGPLTLNGATYAKGLGVHAGSEIDYALGGVYNKFVSYIGVDDEVGNSGSVVFQVWADGVLLYDSGLMTGVTETKLVNIDVTGRQNLKLIVTNGGDNDSSDHANWGNAQLVVGNITPPLPPGPPPPVDFAREQVFGGLNRPTTFDWSPDGQRMYIAQQDGVVRVAVNGNLQAQSFIDISAQVNNDADRGLLGLTVDPFFGQNQGRDYVYLLFTYDPPETQGQNGLAGPDGGGNRPSRLIRVTADPATNYTTVLPNSEVVLLGKNSLWQYTSRPDADSTSDFTILPSGIVNGTTINAPAALIEDADPANIGRDYQATDTNFDNNNNIRDYLATDSNTHSVGQVQFGLDGSLYVTIGDGTSYNAVDPRATRVQDIDNLSGKLLRIDPITGQGFADNPFYNGDVDSNRSKVWSYGFRNPFRFAIEPGTGTPYIGDVGWNIWEEVNVATRGGNFGWPYFEGDPQNQGYSTLPQAQAFYNSGQPVVNALLAGNHIGATAWVVGDFYTGNTFPAVYNGALFYNDVGYGNVYVTFLNPDGTAGATQNFDNLQYIVDMETGPDGSLYYASLYGNEIGRWTPV
ncbi:NPCBM/NEW2 domain-containing protein [Leptolyngbyaceae cyanobacterium UHCC 1019]